MSSLEIADIIKKYPIEDIEVVHYGLDRKLKRMGIHNFPDSQEEIMRLEASSARNLLATLFHLLSGLLAAPHIPSVAGRQNLCSDLHAHTDLLNDADLVSNSTLESMISILKAIWRHATDQEIWDTTIASLRLYRPKTPTNPPAADFISDDEKAAVYNNWIREYIPESHDALRSMIQDNESRLARGGRFYAKTLVFVQSSGMGKSRLVDKYGEICPMITFVLREEKATGYPLADMEVYEFFKWRLSEELKDEILASPRKDNKGSMRNLQQGKQIDEALIPKKRLFPMAEL